MSDVHTLGRVVLASSVRASGKTPALLSPLGGLALALAAVACFALFSAHRLSGQLDRLAGERAKWEALDTRLGDTALALQRFRDWDEGRVR